MLCAKIVWNCRRVRPGKQIFRNCIWFFFTILPTSCSRAWLFIWLIHPKDDSPNVMVLGKEDFKINNIVFNISPRRGAWSSIWAHWKSFWRVIWTKFDGSKEDFQKFSMIFFYSETILSWTRKLLFNFPASKLKKVQWFWKNDLEKCDQIWLKLVLLFRR